MMSADEHRERKKIQKRVERERLDRGERRVVIWLKPGQFPLVVDDDVIDVLLRCVPDLLRESEIGDHAKVSRAVLGLMSLATDTSRRTR